MEWPIRPKKDRFVAALTEFGGSAGNGRLREALRWDEATYNSVKDQLVAEGVVATGRGRGESVALAVSDLRGEAGKPLAKATVHSRPMARYRAPASSSAVLSRRFGLAVTRAAR